MPGSVMARDSTHESQGQAYPLLTTIGPNNQVIYLYSSMHLKPILKSPKKCENLRTPAIVSFYF